MPKLSIEKDVDAAHLVDVVDQWLIMERTALATSSNETEDCRSQAVRAAKEAYAKISTKTSAERVHAGGSASRLLGLRMPGRVPILEKIMRLELADALPSAIVREGMLKRLANTVDVFMLVMQAISPHAKFKSMCALPPQFARPLPALR